jgi:hypothetical protein
VGILLLISKILIVLLTLASFYQVIKGILARRYRSMAVGVIMLGLAGVLVIPNHCQYIADRKKACCVENLQTIAGALDYYYRARGGRYPADPGLLVPNYLKAFPECPAAERDSYSRSYAVSRDASAFTIFCAGNNHSAVVAGTPDYPRFTSRVGIEENP